MIRLFEAYVTVGRWSESDNTYTIMSDSFEGVVKQLKKKFDDIYYKTNKSEHTRQLRHVTIYETHFDDYGIIKIDYNSMQKFEI